MKLQYFIISLIIVCSCSGNKKNPPEVARARVVSQNQVFNPGFQSILDSADVNGSILVYNLNEDTYHSNNFDWAKKGNLPASTFKIANSIIGLESGVVEDDSTLFKWNGEKRSMKIWEQDLIFREAFHISCVPCYQEVARKIGSKRMNENLNKLEYGNMQVDSSNIDIFWLEGDSKISQFQQIDFLN